MPVTVYQYTDAGAPVLNGQAGSLCTVLDAVLVTGYGDKSAAGWAIQFTGVNKRVYRPPTGLLRGALRVQDDAPRAAPFNNACEARITCFEVATTIDLGTGKYPATTNGVILEKSITADAAPRPWIVVADERTVYMFAQSGDYGLGWASFAAGEYFSVRGGGDPYNGLLIGNNTESLTATPAQAATNENLPKLSALTASVPGHFTPRSWGLQGPLSTNVVLGKHGNAAHSAVGLVGLAFYPNPWDQALYLNQVWLHEPLGLTVIRGRMRGFWHCLHPASTLKHGDTWAGSGALAGKTFMAIGPVPDGLGTFVIETSNTWETN